MIFIAKYVPKGKVVTLISAMAKARFYGNTRKKLEDRKRGTTPVFGVVDLDHMRRLIDFENTKAVCVGGMAGVLYITEGDNKNRKELAKKLTSELLRDLGPNSALGAIERIRTGEDVYGHENVFASLPDLVLEYKDGFESRRNPTGDEVLRSTANNGKNIGTHRRNGIFVANGPNVRSGLSLDADIVDIMPTVLAYLEIPVPRHVDGKVLNSAFVESLSVNYEDIAFDRSGRTEYSDDEQAKVEQQLADLGYL